MIICPSNGGSICAAKICERTKIVSTPYEHTAIMQKIVFSIFLHFLCFLDLKPPVLFTFFSLSLSLSLSLIPFFSISFSLSLSLYLSISINLPLPFSLSLPHLLLRPSLSRHLPLFTLTTQIWAVFSSVRSRICPAVNCNALPLASSASRRPMCTLL